MHVISDISFDSLNEPCQPCIMALTLLLLLGVKQVHPSCFYVEVQARHFGGDFPVNALVRLHSNHQLIGCAFRHGWNRAGNFVEPADEEVIKRIKGTRR